MAEKLLEDRIYRPAWADRLLALAQNIQNTGQSPARGQFWSLLNLVLTQRLLLHSRRLGFVGQETISDLASQKALELVAKHDCGQWRPLESTAGELVSFVSTVARNALVDELRRPGRFDGKPLEGEDARHVVSTPSDSGLSRVEKKEFASCLIACAGCLKPEHRTIWLFRVLYEMPSEIIARHPEVGLKPAYVDVILARCRKQMQECLAARGVEPGDLVPGTFTELWKAYRATPPG